MKYEKKDFAEMLLSCGFSVKDTMKITQSTKSSVYRWIAELKENPYSSLNVNNTEEEKKDTVKALKKQITDCSKNRKCVSDILILFDLYKMVNFMESDINLYHTIKVCADMRKFAVSIKSPFFNEALDSFLSDYLNTKFSEFVGE